MNESDFGMCEVLPEIIMLVIHALTIMTGRSRSETALPFSYYRIVFVSNNGNRFQ